MTRTESPKPRCFLRVGRDQVQRLVDGEVVQTWTRSGVDVGGPWVQGFGLNSPGSFDEFRRELTAGQHMILDKVGFTFRVGKRVVDRVTPQTLVGINRERGTLGLPEIGDLVKYVDVYAAGRGPHVPLIVR